MDNTNDPVDISDIVRRVMERLGRQPSGADDSTTSINDSVITASTIEQLTGNPSTICIPAKAVVTPAARDELHRRGIHLQTNTPRDLPATHDPIIDHTDARRGDAVRDQVARRGVAFGRARILLSDCPAADVYRLCSQEREVAVMITGVDDIDRFAAELSPTCWVLDMQRMNVPAAVNAIARISKTEDNNP